MYKVHFTSLNLLKILLHKENIMKRNPSWVVSSGKLMVGFPSPSLLLLCNMQYRMHRRIKDEDEDDGDEDGET